MEWKPDPEAAASPSNMPDIFSHSVNLTEAEAMFIARQQQNLTEVRGEERSNGEERSDGKERSDELRRQVYWISMCRAGEADAAIYFALHSLTS